MASGEWREARSSASEVRSYRDLHVWRRSVSWAQHVYAASSGWPKEERFGLTSQVRRAAVSVAANLAEGAARRTTGEFLQFIGISRGSLAEVETHLLIARGLGFLPPESVTALIDEADEISRMLAGLISSLRRSG